MSSLARPGRRGALTGLVAVAALVLAACATPVTVDPAPQASDPVCAEVLRVLPNTLADQERRTTTSQASRAWGDPPITLRCGVEVPGPTTDRCLAVTGPDGDSVDWVMTELGADEAIEAGWTFTTYGRSPAVEIVLPVEFAGEDPTEVLTSLGAAVQQIPQTRECL